MNFYEQIINQEVSLSLIIRDKKTYFKLNNPINFYVKIDEEKVEFTIPVGDETDLGSIPKMLRSFVSPLNFYMIFSSIVHDFLYKKIREEGENQISRKQSDVTFKEIMVSIVEQENGTWLNKVGVFVVYFAVRLFGKFTI